MVRSHREEVDHRKILRQKYFEDPNYRRLSDIIPGGLDGYQYGGWRDPINWDNLYSYFDEQLADTENRYLSGITTINTSIFASHMFTSEISLEDLLNQYRGHFTSNYDIV